MGDGTGTRHSLNKYANKNIITQYFQQGEASVKLKKFRDRFDQTNTLKIKKLQFLLSLHILQCLLFA
jgi:hypothetical protein